MTTSSKRRWRNHAVVALTVVVVGLLIGYLATRSSPDIREFRVIRDQWERAVSGHAQVQFAFSFDEDTEPLSGDERAAAIERFASRCLELADNYPNTTGELAALYLVVSSGPETTAVKHVAVIEQRLVEA